MKNDFKKRLSSFAWRAGMMSLAVVLDYAVTELTSFQMSPEFTVILGLILGEVSKQVKNELIIREELKKLG